MRETMGATRQELVALEQEDILIPRTRVAKIKNAWRTTDGTALVAELLQGAVSVEEDDTEWATLLLVSRRKEVRLSGLIEAIRERRLLAGQRKGVPGFHGIVVLKSDVDGLLSTLRTSEKLVDIEVRGVMSAAEFGRSVGLRDLHRLDRGRS